MSSQMPFVKRVEWEPEYDKPGQKRAFDEMVTGPIDSVHIERMDDGAYWMALYQGDQRQVVWFTSRGKIIARTERD